MTARRPVDAARVLVAGYLVLVVAAAARSAVQLGTHAGRAPVAYGLSAGAAVAYLTGLLLMRGAAHDGRGVRALTACSLVELTGVLAVGTAGIVEPAAFPDATVWSDYGAGYLFAPVLLPVGVLVWARRSRRVRTVAME